MQAEPEPTLGRVEDTLGWPRSGNGAKLGDKERDARADSGTTPQWSEREAREVSRRVLSVLRRALEADTPGPEKGEPETTRPGDQSPSGTRRKRRRQKRKAHRERRAQTGEESGPSAEGTLEAQASARGGGGGGAQREPATPKPEFVRLLADERRSRDPEIEEPPRRGKPPRHGPIPRLRLTFKAREEEGPRRYASYGPGEHGHGEARTSGNPRRRPGVSLPRATWTEADQAMTGGTWRQTRKLPLG